MCFGRHASFNWGILTRAMENKASFFPSSTLPMERDSFHRNRFFFIQKRLFLRPSAPPERAACAM